MKPSPPDDPATVKRTIDALRSKVLADPTTDGDARRAAIATGGLPVLSSISGEYLLRPDASVVWWDAEDGTCEPADAAWRTITLVRAAERYEELRFLRPARPPEAVECAACAGSGWFIVEGVQYSSIYCGTCHGLGWVRPRPGRRRWWHR